MAVLAAPMSHDCDKKRDVYQISARTFFTAFFGPW